MNAWARIARRLQWKLNFGLWLAATLPVWILSSLAVSAALLVERGRGGAGPGALLGVFAGAVVLSGLVLLVRGRRSFFSRQDCLGLLDEKLRLHNRLLSAAEGVGPWPQPPSPVPPLVRFRFERAFLPALFSVGLVVLSASIPVTLPEPPAPLPVSEPLAWQEIERVLETLRQESAIEEEALEAFEKKLQAIRSRPREEWFRHGSLEAADSLREELSSAMRELARAIEPLESSLAELATLEEEAPLEARRLAGRRLESALEGLELLTLPPDREITRELHLLARDRKARRATKEEIERWKRTRERLYHGLPGHGEAVVVGARRSRGSDGSSGEPGRGGLNRGPASAPIQLLDERTELGTSRIESVRGEDASRGLSGETVGFSRGEHEVDVSGFRMGSEAGAVAGTGEGGELVWSQSLNPRERRVLRKYFQ